MPTALAEPRSVLLAVVVAWALSFPISMLLSALVSTLVPDGVAPVFPFAGWDAIWKLVILAPALETLIMGTVLLVLLAFLQAETAVGISTLGWATAHSLVAPMWGAVIWWPFLIFSILFVTWRQRSLILAFAVPFVAHALQNLLPAVLVAQGVAI